MDQPEVGKHGSREGIGIKDEQNRGKKRSIMRKGGGYRDKGRRIGRKGGGRRERKGRGRRISFFSVIQSINHGLNCLVVRHGA